MHYRFYPEIDSTNEEAKRLYYAHHLSAFPLTIVADKQTQGKGRLGKTWHSDQTEGLYLSFLTKPEEFSYENVASYVYQTAIIIGHIIYRQTTITPTIKRPNDIFLNGKKVCGILMETVGNKPEYVIIGIGININQTQFPEELQEIATSLKLETGKDYSKNTFIREISKELSHVFKGH
jgi:BirA family biotin operon repressor/biotin-[acetyl-CoA-carboxylase] ligase